MLNMNYCEVVQNLRQFTEFIIIRTNNSGKLMFKYFTILLVFLCLAGSLQAQKAQLRVEGVTYLDMALPGLRSLNSASAGLKTVPVGTYSYLSASYIGKSGKIVPDSITSFTFTVLSVPSGSTASLITTVDTFNTKWRAIKIDKRGEYVIALSVTSPLGTYADTVHLFGGLYRGVGGFEGVAGVTGQSCMTCHNAAPKDFTQIYNNWSTSNHATNFKSYVNDPTQTHFSASCFKCHATGADKNVVAANNGFDDIAANLGWKYYGPSANYFTDTLKAKFPTLVNMATVGCESCHGVGSEHAASAGNGDDPAVIQSKIQKSIDNKVCQSCHDAAPRHFVGTQYRLSGHAVSDKIWSNTFANASNTQIPNSLGNCVRCHDAQGYINFMNNVATVGSSSFISASMTEISCAMCHDPHPTPGAWNGVAGVTEDHQLRRTTTGDTLATGFKYTQIGGLGQVCMNCHKSRTDGEAVVVKVGTALNNPHDAPQSDVLLGKNATNFDAVAYKSGVHSAVLANACVDCHMNTDTTGFGAANVNKLGGHTWKMQNPDNGFDNMNACKTCHSSATSFDSFKATGDFDHNGTVGTIQQEVKGLIDSIYYYYLPVGTKAIGSNGLPTISYTAVTGRADSVIWRKAYWNLKLIETDKSLGLHNAPFALSVLNKTLQAINPKWVITDVKDNVPSVAKLTYKLEQNYPNPFNPTTRISFTVPTQGNVKIRIYDVMGNFVKEIFNQTVQAGNFATSWAGDDARGNKVATGVYFYRLDAQNFTMSKKMILMK